MLPSVITDLKLILRVYLQPGAAMSDILDSGSLLFSSIAVLIVSFGLAHWSSGFPFPFYGPLFVLAVIYTPGLLLIGGWVGRTSGSFGSAFQRDYAPLLTCVAVAWSAANLPVALIGGLRPELFVAASGVGYMYCAVLIFFAVRTVFGTGNGAAVAIVSLSWIPLVAAYLLRGPLQYLVGWLASPFLLFYVFFYLRSEVAGALGNLGAGLRRGQSFRRNLEACAINPHDAEAQYQLGLIYQQRRQFTEAIRRFQVAITIDPSETDAFSTGPHRTSARAATGRWDIFKPL